MKTLFTLLFCSALMASAQVPPILRNIFTTNAPLVVGDGLSFDGTTLRSISSPTGGVSLANFNLNQFATNSGVVSIKKSSNQTNSLFWGSMQIDLRPATNWINIFAKGLIANNVIDITSDGDAVLDGMIGIQNPRQAFNLVMSEDPTPDGYGTNINLDVYSPGTGTGLPFNSIYPYPMGIWIGNQGGALLTNGTFYNRHRFHIGGLRDNWDIKFALGSEAQYPPVALRIDGDDGEIKMMNSLFVTNVVVVGGASATLQADDRVLGSAASAQIYRSSGIANRRDTSAAFALGGVWESFKGSTAEYTNQSISVYYPQLNSNASPVAALGINADGRISHIAIGSGSGGSTNFITDANGNGYGVNMFKLVDRTGIVGTYWYSVTTTNGGNSGLSNYVANGNPFIVNGAGVRFMALETNLTAVNWLAQDNLGNVFQVPIPTGSQTPWTSDINGANFFLTNAHHMVLFLGTNGGSGSSANQTYFSNDASGVLADGGARTANGSVSLMVSNRQVWWAGSSGNFLGVGGTNNLDVAGFAFMVKGKSHFSDNVGIGTVGNAANLDVPGTGAFGTMRATNFTLSGTGPSQIAVNILTNVTGQIFDACLPSITQSNLLITPATNMYVWYGPTNANLTNFVTLAVGKVSSPIVVQINNTNGSSCTVLLPSQGAANGAFFSTNGLPSDFATAPPGTNSAYAFRISGSNVICTVTRWKL